MQVFYIVPQELFESNFPEDHEKLVENGTVAIIYQKDDEIKPKEIAKKINLQK